MVELWAIFGDGNHCQIWTALRILTPQKWRHFEDPYTEGPMICLMWFFLLRTMVNHYQTTIFGRMFFKRKTFSKHQTYQTQIPRFWGDGNQPRWVCNRYIIQGFHSAGKENPGTSWRVRGWIFLEFLGPGSGSTIRTESYMGKSGP